MFPILDKLMSITVCLTIFIHIILVNSSFTESFTTNDNLTPYGKVHGSRLNYRSVHECHQLKHGSPPHEFHKAHSTSNVTSPFIKVNHFVKNVLSLNEANGMKVLGTSVNKIVRGRYVVISNPMETLSVLEPDQEGGCALNIRQTVMKTAKDNNCLLAVNAGFFDTKEGSCLGNVISDGRKAHNSNGVQNVNFGLTEDRNIFVGYVSEDMYLSNDFRQLVGGVVWILRNASNYVDVSKSDECEDTEETGPMDRFIGIPSARNAVGHDKDGNVVIIQVDGKSEIDGISLLEMQDLLKDFGLINAINLDGGGSATMVYNGLTINYPYDVCPGDDTFSCDRKVSTILCVHAPYCEPKDCNNHGTCEMGQCICKKNWLPPACDRLLCQKNNCSSHGICTESGCICYAGYNGEDCDKICPTGKYGMKCEELCQCLNGAECDTVTGSCKCNIGFWGDRCQFECPYGYFGKNCTFQCQCNNHCYCDPKTGSCVENNSSNVFLAASCIAKNLIQVQNLVKDDPSEKRKWFATMITLGIITAVCITAVLLLMFCSCSCRCKNEQVLCASKEKKTYRKYRLQVPAGEISDTSESESISMKIFQK